MLTVSVRSARLVHTDLAVERSRKGRGELEFEAEVVPGIRVTWDPATPRQCVSVVVEPEFAVDDPRPRVRSTAQSSDVADRIPWLRLAAITMLDHRLYLPLNRSLLDAELAAAQVAAARTLKPTEPVHDHLVDRALVRARHAARGMVHYLDRLSAAGLRPPPPLARALDTLTGCYATLAARVDDYDAGLVAVTEAADRLATLTAAPARGRRSVPVSPPSPHGAAQIDPRLVPARVLRLGPAADSAEIDITPVRRRGCPAVRVQVPAFEPVADQLDLADVVVRLVDRRSGRVEGSGLLGLLDRCFEGVVSLPSGMTADDVRVELYDDDGPVPETSGDGDDLRRVRRATLFLAGWRALVADALLRGSATLPSARLRGVIRSLAADTDAGDGPLWAGGPALSHLCRLAGLGDRTLAGLLRSGATLTATATAIAGDDDCAAAVVRSTSGPGGLLAAELAAAYDMLA